jgi:hypothetical protein
MRMEWVQFLTYMPFISVAIVAGLFIMALLNFSTLRKSMHMQSEQQIYSRIMMLDLNLKSRKRRLFLRRLLTEEQLLFADNNIELAERDSLHVEILVWISNHILWNNNLVKFLCTNVASLNRCLT